MFGWLMIGASVVIMYRVADAEDRSGILWGAITFALCFGSTFIIPLPLINIIMGLAVSFLSMFILNAVRR